MDEIEMDSINFLSPSLSVLLVFWVYVFVHFFLFLFCLVLSCFWAKSTHSFVPFLHLLDCLSHSLLSSTFLQQYSASTVIIARRSLVLVCFTFAVS